MRAFLGHHPQGPRNRSQTQVAFFVPRETLARLARRILINTSIRRRLLFDVVNYQHRHRPLFLLQF